MHLLSPQRYNNKTKSMILYIFVAICVFIWGTTFISTKALLLDFSPIEILVTRYFIGYLLLWIMAPRRLRLTNKKQELLFAAAGLFGVTLYQFLENVALSYTLASNVSIIVAASPMFTAIAVSIFSRKTEHNTKDVHLGKSFLIGFLLAILGIALVSFNGTAILHLNPLGDLLALLATMSWALYSVLITKIQQLKYPTIEVTRRVFFYALLFMIPLSLKLGLNLDPAENLKRFSTPMNIVNLLNLAVGASALCFVLWNTAIQFLGVIRTSVYIYLIPVVTVVFSIVFLHERITFMSTAGIALTIGGLVFSGRQKKTEKID